MIDDETKLRAYRSIAAAIPRYDSAIRETLLRGVCSRCGGTEVRIVLDAGTPVEPVHPIGPWHDVSCRGCGVSFSIRLPEAAEETS